MKVKGPDDLMNEAVLWAVWWCWTAIFIVTRAPWTLLASVAAATVGTVVLIFRLVLWLAVRRQARKGG